MGYSCSRRANFTLRVIQDLPNFDIQNAEFKYFVEIGRENKDGSITGCVYELVGDRESRNCRKKGSFKINSNGSIVRFPGLSKRMYGVVEMAGIEQYDRLYPKMSLDNCMVTA